MTLIIACASPLLVCQASDRRVTKLVQGSTPLVFSGVENKSLIFLCRDAVGVLGYTGSAFVKGEPTDQWIASQLIGRSQSGPKLGEFFYGGGGFGGLTLNGIFWRLSRSMQQLKLPRGASTLTILGVGFRLRRSRSVPFSKEISFVHGRFHSTSLMRPPRSLQERAFVVQVGDEFPDPEALEAIEEGLQLAADPFPTNFQEAAVHAVRKRADQTSSVGKDVMTVIIPSPLRGRKILWEFHPAESHRAAILGPRCSVSTFDAVYSPWVLTPSAVMCPSVGSGGMTMQCGEWEISGTNRQSSGGPLFGISSQRRTRLR